MDHRSRGRSSRGLYNGARSFLLGENLSEAPTRSINYREYIVRNAMALCVRVISRSYRAIGANEGYTDI